MLTFILLLSFIGIAVSLAWFLVAHDHGEKEPVGALWMAAAFGVLAAVTAGFLESWIIPVRDLSPTVSLWQLFGASLGVGVIEEGLKFLPLSLLIYRKRYFNEHTDGVIYFALAGLGFGVPENILYTIHYGAATGLSRVILTPFFHAATTGMVGYFLVRRKLTHKRVWGVGFFLAIAMVLHGLYDFGLTSGKAWLNLVSVVITLGISATLFILYLRANQHDQDMGLSVVGHNSYCRSCGTPNPRHLLYCVHCGKYA